MASFTEINSDELLDAVVTGITSVPKKQLKQYFVRHSAASDKDLKNVQREWKQFTEEFTDFRHSLAGALANDPNLQRILIQLSVCSSLLGRFDPDNDPSGLYGGVCVTVAEWQRRLGEIFFPYSSTVAFFAVWSPVLEGFNVDWRFHGPLEVVLVSLLQEIEEGDEAYAPLFPGPTPAHESWTDLQATLSDDAADAFGRVFGVQGKLSRRQTLYYNPADENVQLHRGTAKCWAADVLRAAPEIEAFEEEDDEEEDAAAGEKFSAALTSLRKGLGGGDKAE